MIIPEELRNKKARDTLIEISDAGSIDPMLVKNPIDAGGLLWNGFVCINSKGELEVSELGRRALEKETPWPIQS